MENKKTIKDYIVDINPINVIIGVLVVLNSIILFFHKTQELQPQIDQLKKEVEACQTRTTKLEIGLSTNTAEMMAMLESVKNDVQIIKVEVTSKALRQSYFPGK